MNDQQIKRLASYQRISQHFADHPDAWATDPPVIELMTTWNGLLADVAAQRRKQALDTQGATRTVGQKVDDAISLTMTLVQRLRAYATLRGDVGLLPVLDVNATALDEMNDVDMVAEIAAITKAARERPPDALAPFKVTPALLDEVDAATTAVLPKEDAQAAAADQQAEATTALRALFAQFPPLRDVLDDLVDAVIEDEAFRIGYLQARKVTD